MSVSADGRFIAAITDSGFSNKERKYYIGVYDDVAAGTRLTSAEHEPVTSNAFMNASFESHGVEFSSDGKYLITATRDTRVWALDAA
jgi:WD40 repeat protein